MKKKDVISSLLISFGLSLIFRVASHTWCGGLIVGICFFVGAMVIGTKNSNADLNFFGK